MLYEIITGYFIIRIVAELIFDSVPETDIRPQCGCSFCSGIHILG
jgi:hypothetical protein